MKTLSKIILALTVLSLAITACNGKKGYTITGTVSDDMKFDSIFIYQESVGNVGKILNKAKIENGKFTLSGTIDTIQIALIGNLKDDENSLFSNFVLENADYSLYLTPNEFILKGGEINEMVFGFFYGDDYKKSDDLRLKLEDKILAMDMEDPDMEDEYYETNRLLDSVVNVMLKIDDDAKDKVMNDESAPIIAKLLTITMAQNWRTYDTDFRLAKLDEYEKVLGKHINLVNYRNFLIKSIEQEQAKKSIGKGTMFKPIKGVDMSGKIVELTPLISKNKYTLLEFWASWCGPCRGEIPNLKDAYAKYKDKGFEIYSYSIDAKPSQWKKAVEEEGTEWINVILDKTAGGDLSQKYGVDGIPASFLIDQNGIIVALNEELRGNSLDQTLSRLLNK